MKTSRRNWTALIIAIFSLIISTVALYCNWQSFIYANRPYLKITPDYINGLYSITKLEPNEYKWDFKFQLKNVGHIPANDVHVDHEIDFMMKFIPTDKAKGEKLKKFLSEREGSDLMGFDKIPQELMDDEEFNQFWTEMKSKDVIIKPTADRWTSMSVFPGETYEYKLGMIVSGKDAKWYVDNFNKVKWLNFELTAYYRGVLLKIGKPYYSKYKALFDSKKLVPYEVESY